jgi:nitrogen fixation NifU-like protein
MAEGLHKMHDVICLSSKEGNHNDAGDRKIMSADFDRFVEELQASIMEDIREKYSEKAVDHWMHPRNPGMLEKADGHGRITGPCGDTMEIFVRIQDKAIAEISFLTDGCGTTIACGSMLTELAKGKTVAEARGITRKTVLDAIGGLPEEDQHCALLAANTLQAALKDYEKLRRDPWKKHYRTS